MQQLPLQQHAQQQQGRTYQYTHPPTPEAGVTWDANDVLEYIVNNIRALHEILTEGSSANTFPANAVIVGGAMLTALALSRGDIIVGGSGSVEKLGVGANGTVLSVASGVPSWRSVSVTLDRTELLTLGV